MRRLPCSARRLVHPAHAEEPIRRRLPQHFGVSQMGDAAHGMEEGEATPAENMQTHKHEHELYLRSVRHRTSMALLDAATMTRCRYAGDHRFPLPTPRRRRQ